MSKKTPIVAESEDEEHPQFSIQDLLAASAKVDQNVARENEEAEKELAITQHGLVDPAEVKVSAKSGSSKVEKELRERVEFLEQELASAAIAWQERVTDLEGLLTERDEQLQRLAAQLESKAEQSNDGAGKPPIPPVPPAVAKAAGEEEPNPFADGK